MIIRTSQRNETKRRKEKKKTSLRIISQEMSKRQREMKRKTQETRNLYKPLRQETKESFFLGFGKGDRQLLFERRERL